MRVNLIAIFGISFVHVLLAGDPPPLSRPFDEILSGLFGKNIEDKTTTAATVRMDTTSESTIPAPSPETDKYRSCGLDRECIPRFLCQNETINTDGTNIIDVRVHFEDCDYLELCCDVVNKRDIPVINPFPKIKHEGCGYRNPDGVGYRIQGALNNEAEFGEFPWMVAILREEDNDSQKTLTFDCGGALIAPTVIITAAHCVRNRIPNELIVRAGEWDANSEAEFIAHRDERVSEIIVHEKYNRGSLWNDIALVFVREPFKFEETIRPICLPPHDANFDYARCYTTGWGKHKFGKEGVYQSILKRIDLPVMPHNQCQDNLRMTRVGKYFELHESFICAGGERGKDACTGDGGSPLVCPVPGVEDRFYHAGIVAWGIGCGELNVPGVYGNVAYLRPWIDNHLNAKGIDYSHFTA